MGTVVVGFYLLFPINPGGHSLIQMTGDRTLRLLPRAIQQLKLLPKVDTTSYCFFAPYNLFTRRRADKYYIRSLQGQVSDEVFKKHVSKKRELTQVIKYSLKAF